MAIFKNRKRGFITSLFFVFLFIVAACGNHEGESLFEEGETLRKEGRYDEAIEKYSYVVLHYERGEFAPEALFRAGEICYLHIHDFEKAADFLHNLLTSYPWSRRSQVAQKYLAEIFMYKLQDYKQAVVEYQRAISLYGTGEESEQFQFEIAKAYFNLKNFDQQRVELNLLLNSYPDTKLKPEVLFQIANSYFVEGLMDEALKTYQKVIKEFRDTPTAMEATFQMAACLEEKEDLQGALEVLNELVGIYPNYKVIKMRMERIKKRLKVRRRG